MVRFDGRDLAVLGAKGKAAGRTWSEEIFGLVLLCFKRVDNVDQRIGATWSNQSGRTTSNVQCTGAV